MNNFESYEVKDCVLFKQDLHEKAYTKSGVKNFREYVDYINREFLTSSWHRESMPNGQNRTNLSVTSNNP
jgi:hypothetical protein